MWETIRQSTDATVYLVMAMVGTTLFLLKLVLSLVGGHGDLTGHVDGGLDAASADSAEHPDSGAVFTWVSVQSILALLMGMGWAGLAARAEWCWPGVFSLLVACSFGFCMMFFSSFLSYQLGGLSREIVFDLDSCVGAVGRVYLTVPAKGKGQGQVEVVVSGRLKILPAASSAGELAAFSSVRVLDIVPDRTLLVEPVA